LHQTRFNNPVDSVRNHYITVNTCINGMQQLGFNVIDQYFSSRAALFQISDDKVTISAFIVLWMLLLKFFDLISGCKKGPRAAKIRARGPHSGHVCYRSMNVFDQLLFCFIRPAVNFINVKRAQLLYEHWFRQLF